MAMLRHVTRGGHKVTNVLVAGEARIGASHIVRERLSAVRDAVARRGGVAQVICRRYNELEDFVVRLCRQWQLPVTRPPKELRGCYGDEETRIKQLHRLLKRYQPGYVILFVSDIVTDPDTLLLERTCKGYEVQRVRCGKAAPVMVTRVTDDLPVEKIPKDEIATARQACAAATKESSP